MLNLLKLILIILLDYRKMAVYVNEDELRYRGSSTYNRVALKNFSDSLICYNLEYDFL